MNGPTWTFRAVRALGRLITHTAAALTLGQMPPFVSTSAIVLDRGRILVVNDPVRREPVLPGGHLKWRESPIAAMVREVAEETGYTVAPGQLVGVFAGEEWTGEPGIVRVVYEAAVVDGTMRGSAEGEPEWMPVQTLAGSSTRDAALLRGWLERRAATPPPSHGDVGPW